MEQIIYDNIEGREPEIWVPLTCDERIKQPMYEISTYGRVKNNYGHIMKPDVDKDGYLKFTLQSVEGKKLKRFSHRLVGLQFIPNPENKPEINHKRVYTTESGRTKCPHDDNYYKNLEWSTRQENINHSVQNRLESEQRKGEEAPTAKFQDSTVIFICSLLELGYSINKIMYTIGFRSTKDPNYDAFRGLIWNLKRRKAWHIINSMYNY